MSAAALKTQEYFIKEEPYYEPLGDEIEVFMAAYGQKLPVLLKGPTGCGKTRFMEHMAWKLKKPLITATARSSCRPVKITVSKRHGWLTSSNVSKPACRWR